MKRICVYCGSSQGIRSDYQAAAQALGTELVKHQLGLVYGGAKVGLMGIVADAVLQQGGEVIGVIPQALLDKELDHQGLTELHVVNSMHERKQRMAELSDAFIALPGGYGTLEELSEITTWTQLGLHHKPCGVLNIAGFYDGLMQFLDHATAEGFIRPEHRSIILNAADPAELILQLQTTKLPTCTKWINPQQL